MSSTKGEFGQSIPRSGRRRRPPCALVLAAAGGLALVLLVAAGALLAYREYTHATSIIRYTAPGGQVSVDAAGVDGLGSALVTNKGYALYMFPPDRGRRVTCTDDCASAWPPLLVPPGGQVTAGPGIRADLLGTVPNPGGGRVVTYHGWPLYTYIGDGAPRRASGQAVDADGGYWYVMRPSGEIVWSSPRGG
ncbi:MAG: COG4315 family predicted lipoprotein [Candidatus Dormibacteraceae bacterium]